MTDSIVIRVGIPDRCLSPNARVHWARRAKAKKAARYSAQWSAAEAMGRLWPRQNAPKWEAATIEPRVYWPNRHKVDGDNMLASLKSAIDGLTDAGLLADDKGVRFLPCVMGYDKADPRVELVVTKTSAAPRAAGEQARTLAGEGEGKRAQIQRDDRGRSRSSVTMGE